MKVFIIILFVTVASSEMAEAVCENVRMECPTDENIKLASAVEEQLDVKNVQILQMFGYEKWRIVYIDSHVADEAFLFFSDDPLTNHYIALWSGGARSDEIQDVDKWVKNNAPGIPDALVECFSWYVTSNRMK